jgi:hypothetical protein
VRGGVVVSSGGAAFRDPRLFDRNNFTSLVTTVPSADGGHGAHPPPVRTPLPGGAGAGAGARHGPAAEHGAPRPRIAAWRRALESPQTVQSRSSFRLFWL